VLPPPVTRNSSGRIARAVEVLDTFVAASHALDNPSLMTFSQTDPTTLQFLGGGE